MATVTTQDELLAAVTALDPDIVIANNIELTAALTISYTTKLTGGSGISLIWANPRASARNMLIVPQAGNLTMELLTLDAEGRDGTLIFVNGGMLTLNDVVMQNITSTSAQHAVQIGAIGSTSGGTLVMNGGLITGNDTSEAVLCVCGSITMNGVAAISGNRAMGLAMVSTEGGARATLTMAGNTQICDNESRFMAPGGATFSGADVVMGLTETDAPKICDNRSPTAFFGGCYVSQASTLVMRGHAEIANNSSLQFGGGLGVAGGSTILMQDDAAVKNNHCEGYGGGFVLSGSTLTIEGRAQVTGNSCVGNGGGMHIAAGVVVNLRGTAVVADNTAEHGDGIYLAGTLNVSESPRVLDGLYINTTLPVIVAPLSQEAQIQLESSDYVSPSRVPMPIADKGADIAALGEFDRAAWRIPSDFTAGYDVTLNDEQTQVWITLTRFQVLYKNLQGATHQNPESFSVAELPILLTDPSERPGFVFTGWYDTAGNRVNKIALDEARNLVLKAGWEQLHISFDGGASCVCNLPEPIAAEEGKAVIPKDIPTRACCQFFCWNIPSSGSGKVYFPGDVIEVAGASVMLTAQWQCKQ